ncbi:MAG: hypothetical protein AB7S26_19580 [Sandaracinaceae bacterium]
MEDTKTSPNRDPRIAETAERAVRTLTDVGRLWAVHGLNAGRAALETSAVTLRATSGLLSTIAEQLDPDHDRAEEPLDAPIVDEPA